MSRQTVMHSDEEELFTLTVLTENETTALVRLMMTLARHRMRIESLTSTSDSENGMSRHIVLVRAVHDRVRRAVKQIGACVGVLSAEYYAEGETVDREVALFKLDADSPSEKSLRDLVRARRARVLVRADGYVIIEKTGCGHEIRALYDELQPFGVMEFVRSGRVVVRGARPVGLSGNQGAVSVAVEDGSGALQASGSASDDSGSGKSVGNRVNGG